MSRYSVIIADLDGTLFNQQHTMSPLTRKIIGLLVEHGFHFIFATGRHFIDVRVIQEKLGVQCFMITSNGARVHDDQGNLLFKQDIPMPITHQLLQLVPLEHGVITSAYHESGWFVNSLLKEDKLFHPDSGFQSYQFPECLQELPPLNKIFYLGQTEMLSNLARTVQTAWPSSVNVTLSNQYCLEVMASNVSKGHALQRLLAHPTFAANNYTLEDCIAFGDGMNDLEMLSLVGKGCIMANASPQLKESLPELEVIGDNLSDAVAHYLRKKCFI
ncbi:MAG: Cof-type HAD-IIB family hydrolase [Candidatus Symbiodolus clandestinus]